MICSFKFPQFFEVMTDRGLDSAVIVKLKLINDMRMKI